MYRVHYHKKAQKQLQKLDKPTSKKIISWLTKNIDGTTQPRQHGKRLTGNLSQYWRYRVGDYRIICDIQDDKLIVLAVDIAHRKDIYE